MLTRKEKQEFIKIFINNLQEREKMIKNELKCLKSYIKQLKDELKNMDEINFKKYK